MEVSKIRIDKQNQRFVRDIYYSHKDGLPIAYTLHLEETAHPANDSFYKNGDWGSWDCSPQTLTIIHHKWENHQAVDESIELCKVENDSLRWLDIYDGIIIYSSTGNKYENMVLYNILTKQKLVIDHSFIPKDEDYDHFRYPKLWVNNNVIYIQFDAVEGWYDGGEDCGSRIFCFDKNTLKQLEFKDTNDTSADVWKAIENRGEEVKFANGSQKRFYYPNLFPDYYHNRYHVKEITSIIHEVRHKEHRYKDCPRSLIKQMCKIRLDYAKKNNLKVTPYKIMPYYSTIWHKLGKFFEKVGNNIDNRRRKRFNKKYKNEE